MYGDELLKRDAGVLRDGPVDGEAYRIGGGEFAFVIHPERLSDVTALAKELSATLAAAGVPVTIGVSVLDGDHTPGALRGQALAAAQEARRRREPIGHYEHLRDELPVITPAKRDALRRLLAERRLTAPTRRSGTSNCGR